MIAQQELNRMNTMSNTMLVNFFKMYCEDSVSMIDEHSRNSSIELRDAFKQEILKRMSKC